MPGDASPDYLSGMNRNLRRGWLVLALAATLGLAACGSDDSSDDSSADAGSAAGTPTASASTTAAAASTEPAEPGATETTVNRTPELDAIGVIGHSGATGYDSDGQQHDVPANSFVTGTNPKVDSIYRRLLADHPALEGHNWNEAVSGSSVLDLMHQAQALLGYDPVPDIVFIVSIDNDVRCDGSDEDNYDDFEAGVTEVVDYLQGSAPGMKVFFNDTPLSVHDYDAVLMKKDGGEAHISDPGSPCNAVKDGAVDPAGEAYQQQVFDEYYGRLGHICATREGCATDEGMLQSSAMKATPVDIAEDLNHFTVSGLAKVAAIVWDKLPGDWK
jgi:hypothetical protein